MRLKPYNHRLDYGLVESWTGSRREHALWCADEFSYPLEPENMYSVLRQSAESRGEMAFVMGDHVERPRGFFCYSFEPVSREGYLRFIVVDSSLRSQGLGRQMLDMALRYAFGCTEAQTVRLMVFESNRAAMACYESLGFVPSGRSEDFLLDGECLRRLEMVISREAYISQ